MSTNALNKKKIQLPKRGLDKNPLEKIFRTTLTLGENAPDSNNSISGASKTLGGLRTLRRGFANTTDAVLLFRLF